MKQSMFIKDLTEGEIREIPLTNKRQWKYARSEVMRLIEGGSHIEVYFDYEVEVEKSEDGYEHWYC